MPSDLSVTQSGIDRHNKSLQKLYQLNIGYKDMPNVFYCNEYLQLRSKEQIINRVIVTTILASKAEGLNPKMCQNLMAHFDVVNQLTISERNYLLNANATKVENLKYHWQFEKACILLTAIGIIKQFFPPKEICDSGLPGKILKVFPSKKRLLENSYLIDASTILDEADLYFKLNEVRKKYFKVGNLKEIPFNPASILERHYALSWLINYKSLSWDELEREVIN